MRNLLIAGPAKIYEELIHINTWPIFNQVDPSLRDCLIAVDIPVRRWRMKINKQQPVLRNVCNNETQHRALMFLEETTHIRSLVMHTSALRLFCDHSADVTTALITAL